MGLALSRRGPGAQAVDEPPAGWVPGRDRASRSPELCSREPGPRSRRAHNSAGPAPLSLNSRQTQIQQHFQNSQQQCQSPLSPCACSSPALRAKVRGPAHPRRPHLADSDRSGRLLTRLTRPRSRLCARANGGVGPYARGGSTSHPPPARHPVRRRGPRGRAHGACGRSLPAREGCVGPHAPPLRFSRSRTGISALVRAQNHSHAVCIADIIATTNVDEATKGVHIAGAGKLPRPAAGDPRPAAVASQRRRDVRRIS